MWFNELTITSYEINSDKKKIFRNLIFLIILYMFLTYYIFLPSKNLLYIPIIIFIFLILKFIYINKNNFFYNFKNLKIKKKFNYKTLSTISINLANLIWRIFFFVLLEKEYSGVLFSVFALMSFPSSLYSNTIGMLLETQNKYKYAFKHILMIYYFFILYVMYYIFVNKIIMTENNQVWSIVITYI